MEKSVFPVGNQMEQVFPQKIFRKKGNTSRGIPLFSVSPELPENHCTIYFITLVPCSLAKNKRFRSRMQPSFMFECLICGFHFEQVKHFLKTQIRGKAILPLPTKCIDFLGQYTFRNVPVKSKLKHPPPGYTPGI